MDDIEEITLDTIEAKCGICGEEYDIDLTSIYAMFNCPKCGNRPHQQLRAKQD